MLINLLREAYISVDLQPLFGMILGVLKNQVTAARTSVVEWDYMRQITSSEPLRENEKAIKDEKEIYKLH